ncbi:MAG: CarD family transcriptional regulator [Spirochaetia bacterium]
MKKNLFSVHQEVVYPLQGIGRIQTIEERDFKGQKVLYYNIYLKSSDMTALVPADRVQELGIRPIAPKKEAQRVLDLIAEDFEPLQGDWKTRYQINHNLLKQGSVMDITTVVRALYHRSKVKELPILERKLFDSALKMLVDEISYSLDKPTKEVERIVFSKLEPGGDGDILGDMDDDIFDDDLNDDIGIDETN